MAHTPGEAVLDEVLGQGLLPAEGGVPGPVQAQAKSTEIIWMCLRIFRRNLDVQASGALRVKVRPGHVVHHHLIRRLAVDAGGRLADDEPQRLERRRARVERIIWTGAKFLAYQTTTNLRIGEISFIRINPFRAYNLPTSFTLLGAGHALVHAHPGEVFDLGAPRFVDQAWVERRARDVVARHLDAVLGVQAHELSAEHGLALDVIVPCVQPVPIELMCEVPPVLGPRSDRLEDFARSALESGPSGGVPVVVDLHLDAVQGVLALAVDQLDREVSGGLLAAFGDRKEPPRTRSKAVSVHGQRPHLSALVLPKLCREPAADGPTQSRRVYGRC